MDLIDHAAMREEAFRDAALARFHHASQGPSAEFCQMDHCGEPIPQARRLAAPGCQYCIDCQQMLEHDNGRRLG
ncbi:phage/conjugal plasmid C-4 type zinc finger TraR family protein [Chitinivorax tropicus]|uniref:Phage/conjugal plasmid C-4 type zinc finger TraR family protein n=1 Tax=Chitinivorax tropicus TaxID=714531 RepID=A0A840MQ83_9PROT|nr:TraR/DksA C4-type zinc finger protein [Chitinivorax tropicus]MBB5017411.1 phage/conjugal plasmid C-4 type zinc finger TraR family protein [Chitinivorax tropicus]